MGEKNAEKRISLLKAYLAAAISFAVLFIAIVLGIWVYTGLIIQREKSLVSQFLPELDAAHRLTAATAGLQSQGLLLRSAQSATELQQRRAALDNTIIATRQTIDTLVITELGVRFGLEKAVESMASFVLNLADVKQSQIDLQERIKVEKLRLLDDIAKMEKDVQRQVVLLTEQLLDRSELMESVALLDDDGSANRESFSVQLDEYDQINLAIQDYLLFAQDLVSLGAIVESLPLLRNTTAVDIALQNHGLLIRALVSRSIYIRDNNDVQRLLLPLGAVRDSLSKPGNLFAMQKNVLTLESDQYVLDQLMTDHTSEILAQTDKLSADTSAEVSTLAAQTLDGLERYRYVLVLLSLVALCALAGVSYWLVYRKTVLPLVEITQRFQDVGSTRFPERAQQYYLQELSTLSEAMQQLNSVQNDMQFKDAQLQLINSDLKRVNEDLEQFAHIASHDLQEPLRKLQQFSNLLEEDYESLLDDDGRFFLRTIRTSAQRMSALIKETLAYSRAGSAGQTFERVDLSDLLSALIDEMDIAVSEAEADVTIGALPAVHANKVGMAQLFRNLLLNALKYRKPGTPTIISIDSVWLVRDVQTPFGVQSAAHTNGKLRIRIRDNGIGIPEKYQKRIFSPFERLRNDDVPGTGLGLAMCRKVCDSHEWDLSVSSEPGAGSLFELHVPAKSVLDAGG